MPRKVVGLVTVVVEPPDNTVDSVIGRLRAVNESFDDIAHGVLSKTGRVDGMLWSYLHNQGHIIWRIQEL